MVKNKATSKSSQKKPETPNLFPGQSVTNFINQVQEITAEIQELYSLDDTPWIVGYSGGKDSTTILQLVWNAISRLPAEKRTKTIHVITTDTQVENPFVATWVRQSLAKIEKAGQVQNVPIIPHLLHPAVKNTFWVCLMGKGYPAPRYGFRWCTERMKIQPVNQFIREILRIHTQTILVLGIRKAESVKRAATMNKYEAERVRARLSPNGHLPNSLIYSPIEDWRNDEVWLYLNQWENPWGHSNKDLFTMYRGATADNECPLVVDTSTPSCGDSRFGCWVCTMVSKDKSMEAMIQNDQEKEWMQPLLDIRNELDDLEKDKQKRDFRRIYGKVELFERNSKQNISVEPIPGPYTKTAREYWLRRVLEAQTQIRQTAPLAMRDITLITVEELSEIRRIWLEEKHEFDDALPKIYQEVTGEAFEDPRPINTVAILGAEEWNILEEICEGDGMYLELMARLLNTERQFFTKGRRAGIFESLVKCFDSSSRSQEEAIKNAHYHRAVKQSLADIQNNLANVGKLKEVLENEDLAEALSRATYTRKPKSGKQRKSKKATEDMTPNSTQQLSFLEPENSSKTVASNSSLNQKTGEVGKKQLSWADLKFQKNSSEQE